MTPLATWGIQEGTKAFDAGMGLLLGGINDRRQVKQQRKLGEMQLEMNQRMADFNFKKQLELFEKTGYGAQKDQMIRAGLNPALLYGMGGSGGGTTAAAQAGPVSGAQAPSGGGEAAVMMGMGLQYRLQEAQIQVMESQAAKNKAEATKTAGIDTQESQARIDSLLQGVDNARQQHQLQKLAITLGNIENYEKQASQQDRLDFIRYQTRQAMKQLDIVENEAYISDATLQQKIEIIRQTAIGAAIENELKRSNISVNKEQINQWIQGNMREWDKMTQENKRIAIQKLAVDNNIDQSAMDNIFKAIGVVTNLAR